MLIPDLSDTTWRKSSRSGSDTDCVEVAEGARAIAVRDSKDRTGPVLAFSHAAWSGFVTGVAGVAVSASGEARGAAR